MKKEVVKRRSKAQGAGYTGKGCCGDLSQAEESDSEDQWF